jgi:DNA polymerase-3 subunit alpha
MVEDGKKLISKDRVVNLIKAGAFDKIENSTRREIMKKFLSMTCEPKKRLTLQNFAMLCKYNLIPNEYEKQIKVYNFTKYVRKHKFATGYIIDDIAKDYLVENGYPLTWLTTMRDDSGMTFELLSKGSWDAVYEREMNIIRAYISQNHAELLEKLNHALFMEEWNKYAGGDEIDWELDGISFYYSGHPLTNLQLPIPISKIADLRENDFDGFWTIKGKQVPKYRLSTIVGTVLDKDTTKGTLIVQTPDGVIDVKIPKQQFAHYAHKIKSEDDEDVLLEDSFFAKGTHLVLTGIIRNEIFIPKTYKSTGYDPILKIVLDENGNLDYLMRKGESAE